MVQLKYTTTSIISPSKRNEYCPAGEKVEVVHISGNVAICEWKGDRFPCHINKLTDIFIEPPQDANQPKKRESTRHLSQIEKIQMDYLNSIKK